jgi:hypothetical protein
MQPAGRHRWLVCEHDFAFGCLLLGSCQGGSQLQLVEHCLVHRPRHLPAGGAAPPAEQLRRARLQQRQRAPERRRCCLQGQLLVWVAQVPALVGHLLRHMLLPTLIALCCCVTSAAASICLIIGAAAAAASAAIAAACFLPLPLLRKPPVASWLCFAPGALFSAGVRSSSGRAAAAADIAASLLMCLWPVAACLGRAAAGGPTTIASQQPVICGRSGNIWASDSWCSANLPSPLLAPSGTPLFSSTACHCSALQFTVQRFTNQQ